MNEGKMCLILRLLSCPVSREVGRLFCRVSYTYSLSMLTTEDLRCARVNYRGAKVIGTEAKEEESFSCLCTVAQYRGRSRDKKINCFFFFNHIFHVTDEGKGRGELSIYLVCT